jgi:hypothetical protein
MESVILPFWVTARRTAGLNEQEQNLTTDNSTGLIPIDLKDLKEKMIAVVHGDIGLSSDDPIAGATTNFVSS